MIPTSVAARLLGYHIRHIQYMCSMGFFQTARRPLGPRSHYKLSRAEVIVKKYGGELSEQLAKTKK